MTSFILAMIALQMIGAFTNFTKPPTAQSVLAFWLHVAIIAWALILLKHGVMTWH